MAGVMFTIVSPSGPLSLREASSRLHVDLSALDVDFGVTPIDPRRGLYAVLVDSDAARSVMAQGAGVEGPFANPGIGAFGPPDPKRS